MKTNRISVELADAALNTAATPDAPRTTERSEVSALAELELVLVGGGGNDTVLW